MKSYNQVIIMGNAGKDAEVRILPDGKTKVATVLIATSQRGFTRRDGSKIEPRTDWHTVVLWRGLAELAEKYVKKGDPLQIVGELRNRSYEDKSGVKRYVTEIMARDIMLLSGVKKEEVKVERDEEESPEITKEDFPQGYEGTENEGGDLPF